MTYSTSFEAVLPDADCDHSDESSYGQILLEPNEILSSKAADSDVERKADSEAGSESDAEADSDTEITTQNQLRG